MANKMWMIMDKPDSCFGFGESVNGYQQVGQVRSRVFTMSSGSIHGLHRHSNTII